MRALPIILLALLIAAAVVAALVLFQGDSSTAEPALGHPAQPGLAPGQVDLAAAIRSLDQSVQRLTARLDTLERPATKSEAPAKAPPGPSAEPMDKLTAAIEHLDETLRTRPPGQGVQPVVDLRPVFDSQSGREPQETKERFPDLRAASQALVFKTYRQVLSELGSPEWISVADSGSVRWQYAGLNVHFADGYVYQVYLDQ